MNTQELLTAYHKVVDRQRTRAGTDRLPRMEAGEVEIMTELVADHDEVVRQLKVFAPSCGWIGFQSKNSVFTNGVVTVPDEDDTGLLLSAECYNTVENESLHIRQDGAGGWLLIRVEMRAGNSAFFDTVALVAADKELRWLRYRRYWHIDAEHGAEPFAACFIGFGEG